MKKKLIITEEQYKKLKSKLNENVDGDVNVLDDLKNDINASLTSAIKFSNTLKSENDRYYVGVIDSLEMVINKINKKIGETNEDNDFYHDELHGY